MPITFRFLAKVIAVLTVILIAEWFSLFGVAHLQEIQADSQSIPRPSVQFNYVEPVEMLKSAGTELSYRSKLDIEDNGISLNEAEVWRSNNGNRLIAGLHFQGKDASSSNSRLVVVLRDKKGSPWYIGDAPLYDPATPSVSLSNEIWVILEFDEKAFSQDARFNAE